MARNDGWPASSRSFRNSAWKLSSSVLPVLPAFLSAMIEKLPSSRVQGSGVQGDTSRDWFSSNHLRHRLSSALPAARFRQDYRASRPAGRQHRLPNHSICWSADVTRDGGSGLSTLVVNCCQPVAGQAAANAHSRHLAVRGSIPGTRMTPCGMAGRTRPGPARGLLQEEGKMTKVRYLIALGLMALFAAASTATAYAATAPSQTV